MTIRYIEGMATYESTDPFALAFLEVEPDVFHSIQPVDNITREMAEEYISNVEEARAENKGWVSVTYLWIQQQQAYGLLTINSEVEL